MSAVHFVWIQFTGTVSGFIQPAPAFKGCWVLSPALSGSHKDLSSVGWEGMTLKDFGSECLCGFAAVLTLPTVWVHQYIGMCIWLCPWDVSVSPSLCSPLHWTPRAPWCACMHFLLFSHLGTLSSDRCTNQSAEREHWKQDVRQAVVLALGQRHQRKQGRVPLKKWRRSAEYVALNLVPEACAL